MSTHPQVGTQLGTDSHGCSYGRGASSHPSHREHLCRSERSGSVPSLHTRWTTLGVERHVDLWTNRSSVHSDLCPLPALRRLPAHGSTAVLLATVAGRRALERRRP